MAWYFWLLTIFCLLGGGIALGIFFERLGQWNYFRKLGGGGGVGMSILQRANKFAKDNQKVGHADTVFVGDSITEGYDLNSYFPNKNYLNRGISGDKSGGVLNRINSNVIVLNPKKVVMMIGTNDLHDNIGYLEVFENTKKSIDEIRSKLPNCVVIIEALYPVNESKDGYSRGTGFNKMVAQINVLLKGISDDKNVIFVDTYHALADGGDDMNENYTRDGLHLNANGYKIVTELLKPLLD